MTVKRVALISLHTCPLAAPGQGKTGGMNVYVRELSRNLARSGVELDIFTRTHEGHGAEVVALEDRARVVHLEAIPSEAPLDVLYSYLPPFLDELYAYTQREGKAYQLVHSHYWLSGWAGRRAAATWGVPHVSTFHTLAELKVRAKAGEMESPLRSEVERELMSASQLIIASSPHEREAMVRLYGAPADRIAVVPCGVDLDLFRPLEAGEARERLGLNGEKVIVYAGRIEPIKGLELLLRSAAIMESQHPIKLLVVGGDVAGNGEVTRLKCLAAELGIEDMTEFVGTVDHQLLPLYYNAADVCVVPSYYESFGLVALEALACGTPVVASRVGGLPSVVQHGRTGYLMSRRCPEAFADSLEMILCSRGLQTSMRRLARKRAEGLGWKTVAEETRRLYNGLEDGTRYGTAG